jgi:hypothetical protein
VIRRVTWIVVVGLFVVIAVAAPVKIVSKQAGRPQSASYPNVGSAVVRMAALKFAPDHAGGHEGRNRRLQQQ